MISLSHAANQTKIVGCCSGSRCIGRVRSVNRRGADGCKNDFYCEGSCVENILPSSLISTEGRSQFDVARMLLVPKRIRRGGSSLRASKVGRGRTDGEAWCPSTMRVVGMERKDGGCECGEFFEGSACDKLKCPNECCSEGKDCVFNAEQQTASCQAIKGSNQGLENSYASLLRHSSNHLTSYEGLLHVANNFPPHINIKNVMSKLTKHNAQSSLLQTGDNINPTPTPEHDQFENWLPNYANNMTGGGCCEQGTVCEGAVYLLPGVCEEGKQFFCSHRCGKDVSTHPSSLIQTTSHARNCVVGRWKKGKVVSWDCAPTDGQAHCPLGSRVRLTTHAAGRLAYQFNLQPDDPLPVGVVHPYSSRVSFIPYMHADYITVHFPDHGGVQHYLKRGDVHCLDEAPSHMSLKARGEESPQTWRDLVDLPSNQAKGNIS